MALHIENRQIRSLLLKGNFGLEKESLRITPDGRMSHTDHPFSLDDSHITRDFCENQTEINTSVHKSFAGVLGELSELNTRIAERLSSLPQPELLWPFSNPPYILADGDIPVARFKGKMASKSAYRNILSDKYGRYKMTFSGIHFNYSFAGDLLRADYEAATGRKLAKGDEDIDFRKYSDALYLSLAQNVVAYGWVLVALTAASPLLDGSYFGSEGRGNDLFTGMASVRCSELGYWNFFTPVLDYTDIMAYVASIRHYIDSGMITAVSELYYPVRLKPRGLNSLDSLIQSGINHIELRCIDLNPLSDNDIDERDLSFAQLMLVWLASQPATVLSPGNQVQAMQNYKSAAHLDLYGSKITLPDGSVSTASEAVEKILYDMIAFYRSVYRDENPELYVKIKGLLDYQMSKIKSPRDNSYAWIVRNKYSGGFVEKGLHRAVELNNKHLNVQHINSHV